MRFSGPTGHAVAFLIIGRPRAAERGVMPQKFLLHRKFDAQVDFVLYHYYSLDKHHKVLIYKQPHRTK